MNRLLFSCAASLLLFPLAAFASDQVRNVQTELKSQGFYYGEVNGETTSETTAALRRFQIRNGLEVTGTLSQETLDRLGISPGKASARSLAVPVLKATPAPARQNPLREKSPSESDRTFLQREEATHPRPPSPRSATPTPPPFFNGSRGDEDEPPRQRNSSIVRPPAPLETAVDDLSRVFAGTPYETAPRSIQQRTLRNAQAALASRGFYREDIDGEAGPATEEALLTFQRFTRLPLTGRLDLPSLARLRLLPGDSRPPILEPFNPREAPRRTYRGVWVN